jgi:hypothetical protein
MISAASGTIPSRQSQPDGAVVFQQALSIIFQAMRAVLLASATAANFDDLRLRSSSSQGDAFPLR